MKRLSPVNFCAISVLVFLAVAEGTGEPLQEPEVRQRSDGTTKGCSCEHFACACCFEVDQESNTTTQGCVNVSYASDIVGVKLAVSLNEMTLLKGSVSAKDPSPKICSTSDEDEDIVGLEFCFEFSDLRLKSPGIHGCVEIAAKVATFGISKEVTFEVGCFDLGKEESNFPIDSEELAPFWDLAQEAMGSTSPHFSCASTLIVVALAVISVINGFGYSDDHI